MKAASLRLRLGLAGLVCVLGALGLAALGLSSLFATHAERRAEIELTQHFDQILAGLTRENGALGVSAVLSDPRFTRVYGGLYWQIDAPDGQSRSRSLWDSSLTAGDATQDPRFLRVDGPGGAPVLIRSQRVALPPALGGASADITVGLDARTLDRAQRAFTADMLPYLAVLAVGLFAAGSLQIHLGLRPLAQLRDRVGGLRRGQSSRMGAGWPPEVAPLTREVDALLDQHEQEVRGARNRAADLAHGLKTPLQAILGEAERLRAGGNAQTALSLEDLVARIRRQVDAELMRARFEGGETGASSNPRRVAQGVLSVLARVPDAAALELRNDIPPDLELRVGAEELSELVGVLAENAVRHARSLVRLGAAPGHAAVTLTIADDGPGLPPSRLELIQRRGARLDERGSGLGLDIARTIVERHGGAMTLAAGPEGGLEVTLTLPAAQ